jgi:hypothetical protein
VRFECSGSFSDTLLLTLWSNFGANVMVAIFDHVNQFSARKMAIFLKFLEMIIVST